MQVAQHRSSTVDYQTEPISYRSTTMSNRMYQPLTFSIDDRLSNQHFTTLDLCSKNLKKIEKLQPNIQFNVVLLDHNDITKIEHLDILTHLIQLSISHNRLIDIRLLGRLRTLQKLNLSHNSLDSIEPLKALQNLVILNISSNNIQNLSALNACHLLQSLDASDNAIRHIDDFSPLTSLKYLNLHKNLIDTLMVIPKYWPKSIHTLIISDNEIRDLTEISYLSSLIDLNTLYIHDNPCFYIIDDRHGCHQPFDYRPYVLNWNLSVQNLDGISITRKESLKAEWLLTQGKGRSFRAGEHHELVQYLIKTCGTDADERDDLHLSRIMQEQDFHQHSGDKDVLHQTSDTIKDANDTLPKFQQSLLLSESEFVKLSPTSSIDETSQTFNLDQTFTNRYSDYDNRPIKPLDQNLLQSKLNQYPVDTNITQTRSSKRTTAHLAYNATSREPTTSAIVRPKSTKTSNKTKRHTIAADTANTFHLLNRLTSETKVKSKQQITEDEDEELQLKSAPAKAITSTQNTTNKTELKKITKSMETMRTSMLQAYLDLHERFTRTTELQTSALAALWKMFETQNLTHQRKTDQILQENRLLNQRIRELESRLNPQARTSLHPPLHARISKRDTKSFFLHWTANPLNNQQTMHGYRIYIDDILKITTERDKSEAIIDCIREEGDYRIKVRTYDQYGESEDSNIVVARFRRQAETKTIQHAQSDENITPIINNQQQMESSTQEQQQITPEQNKKTPSTTSSSAHSDNHINNGIPSKSPSLSPKYNNNKITTNDFYNKVLSENNSNDSSSSTSAKRSPVRTGIMSRLAKSPHRMKRNNVLLNALPIHLTPSPTENINTNQSETFST